jgi:hypothetical protein
MEDRPYRGEGPLHQRFRLFARAFGDPEFAADPHRACCDHGDKPGLNLSVLWPARLPGAGGLLWQINKSLPPYVSHSAAEGALPSLFAATSPEAKAAGYYGPNGFYELKGPPVAAKIMPQAKDVAVAARLWDVSAALTVRGGRLI